jgi:hypothetical protein
MLERVVAGFQGHGDIVGASLLAMVVNDNAGLQDKRGVLESFASKLAPSVE